MTQNHNLQHDYMSDLLNVVPLSTTGEIAVILSEEIDSDIGFIVIDRGINSKEERMMYHRKDENTVYVYTANRISPRDHEIGAKVILDSISSINYAHDNGFEQMYVIQKSDTDVIIKGGNFFLDKRNVTLIDLDTELGEYNLSPGVDNYIYIDLDLDEYIVTTTPDTNKYPVAVISVDVGGSISNIDSINAISIGGGLTTADKEKLDGLNKDDYEKVANKTESIRAPASANHTKFPTEKAVSDALDEKVNKVTGHGLSKNSYTDDHKTKVQELIDAPELDLEPFEIKENKVESIRSLVASNHEKYPTEKAVRVELDTKVTKESGKSLSDFNYTAVYKNALDSLIALDLENMDFSKTPVLAGRGIDVEDLGDDGWRVNNTSHSNVGMTGEHIDVNPVDEYTRVKFLDEQKYVVLEDTYRSGVYGNAKFKDGNNPNIRVFYHNPGNAGKILIDTHIRVVNEYGAMSEVHKSIPYLVDVINGHGVFELSEESFDGLDYDNSSTIYIKVHRVGAFVTDHNGTEFNSEVNDLDTVTSEIRVKSMFIDYEQTLVIPDPSYAYKHNESYESDTWSVAYELGTKSVIIQAYGTDGIPIEYDSYHFIDYDNLEIEFTAPVAGTAVILAAGGMNTDLKDKNFEEDFTNVTGGATFIHNLDKYPSVVVLDDTGSEIEVSITHTDKNSISISWVGTYTGKVIAN